MLNAPGVFLNHFWSLAIEEQFYLVWPAIVLICQPKTFPRLCVAIILCSLAARLAGAAAGLDVWQLTAGTPFHVDALAVGAWLAWCARNPGGLAPIAPLARRLTIALLVLLIATIWTFGGLREQPLELCFTLSLLAVFFGATLTVLVAEPEAAFARLIARPTLRLFGRYSYGLYVFASLLQPYLERIFATRIIALYVRSFALAGILHLILQVGSCLAVAMVSYHLFEMRFLGLKKYFEYRPPLRADEAQK
jgi:peptidoglycan/LPS O-acetylase OafA/YrhL